MLAAGLFAGSLVYRRRSARRTERVDIYGADGSMLSLVADSLEAERLLGLARELLEL